MEDTNIMTHEVAKIEVEKWFDFRKVKETFRKSRQELGHFDNLIDGFCNGNLVFKPDSGILTQKLEFPVKDENGNEVLKELNFKPRTNVFETREAVKGLDPNDGYQFLVSGMSMLCNVSKGMLYKIDTVDASLSGSIAAYFPF